MVAAGRPAATTVAWREGTRGKLRSRFVALRVRPAGVRLRRAVQGGELPARWLRFPGRALLFFRLRIGAKINRTPISPMACRARFSPVFPEWVT